MKMKRKYFIYTMVITAGLQLLSACKDSFLNVDPKGTILESTYYSNPQEVFTGLVAAYSPMGWETATSYLNIGGVNAASDDCFAGGASASDMLQWHQWDEYDLSSTKGPQQDYWNRNFTGIARVNVILDKLSKKSVPGLDDATKQRYIAEAEFLRGYYYFDLVRIFRNVPLFTSPVSSQDIYNQLQATPDQVYAQIEKDLNAAMAVLPLTVPSSTEGGRATKGAAQALLGKVLLYEKKYNAAAQQFAVVNGAPGGTSTYGYHLLSNFADIFRPDNKFNSESILEIVHSNVSKSNWSNWGHFTGNVATTMFGPRSYTGPLLYSGWSFNTITPDLRNFLHYDPRYQATIIDLDSMVNAGVSTYVAAYQNTGFFIRKFAPLLAYKSPVGTVELNYPQDYIEIRLADTYLMEAEALVQSNGDLTRAAALLNAVRSRVGLGPIPATLSNIYDERRRELATEGHRWFDLVRTGRAAQVLGARGFTANKNEILPIPLHELENTKLIQNPGYN